MAQNEDWRDMLGALASSMPRGNEPEPDPVVVPAQPRQTQRLDIVTERKGHAGKCATIICGFTIPDDDIAELAADLRRALACGGSVRGGEILLQGDRARDVLRLLTARSMPARII